MHKFKGIRSSKCLVAHFLTYILIGKKNYVGTPLVSTPYTGTPDVE